MTSSIYSSRAHAGRALAAHQVLAVAEADTCAAWLTDADEIVCAATPEPFLAVSHWDRDVAQTADDEVRALLARAVSPSLENPP